MPLQFMFYLLNPVLLLLSFSFFKDVTITLTLSPTTVNLKRRGTSCVAEKESGLQFLLFLLTGALGTRVSFKPADTRHEKRTISGSCYLAKVMLLCMLSLLWFPESEISSPVLILIGIQDMAPLTMPRT